MTATTHGEKLLALLESRATTGATGAEIKDHTRATVSTYVTRYVALGLIGYIDEPAKRSRGVQFVRRYWLRAHCPPGATFADQARQPRQVKRKALQDIPDAPDAGTIVKPRPPLTASAEFRAAEPDKSRAKITVWVPPPDPRAVGTPEKFFAAGKWLKPSPWAEAVAGGAR